MRGFCLPTAMGFSRGARSAGTLTGASGWEPGDGCGWTRSSLDCRRPIAICAPVSEKISSRRHASRNLPLQLSPCPCAPGDPGAMEWIYEPPVTTHLRRAVSRRCRAISAQTESMSPPNRPVEGREDQDQADAAALQKQGADAERGDPARLPLRLGTDPDVAFCNEQLASGVYATAPARRPGAVRGGAHAGLRLNQAPFSTLISS